MSQRQIADALGISQSAVSQQLKYSPEIDKVDPQVLLQAAAPVLKALAAEHDFTKLAVFGSVASAEVARSTAAPFTSTS